MDPSILHQLVLGQPDLQDVPGWFFTSTADEVYYYFLAIPNTTTESLCSNCLELIRTRSPTQLLGEKLLRSNGSFPVSHETRA